MNLAVKIQEQPKKYKMICVFEIYFKQNES